MEYKCLAAAFPDLSQAALFQLASTPHGQPLALTPYPLEGGGGGGGGGGRGGAGGGGGGGGGGGPAGAAQGDGSPRR